MKTKEELNALKNEVEILNKKLAELTEEELAEVSGGIVSGAQKNSSPIMSSIMFTDEAGSEPVGLNPHRRS